MKFFVLLLAFVGCAAPPPPPAAEYIKSVRAFREKFVMPWIQRDPDLRTPEGAVTLQAIQDAIAAQAQYETTVLPPDSPEPPK